MEWKNELTKAIKIEYPIVQAPMLGVTSPAMVAQISNLGGLGSLPVGGLSPDQTLSLIRETKKLTNKPFAVNLFVYDIPASEPEQVRIMQDFLLKLSIQNNINIENAPEPARFYSYTEQVEILLKENIPVVSFTFGILDTASIEAFKEKDIILIGTATCVKEAMLLDEKGIDIITAQGIEAGGHRGTFLDDEPLPIVGLFSLVPQITNHIPKPVLAAGGICNGKTIKAAFALGAKGVQIGSAFIASDESIAIPSYKTAIQHSSETDSMLTKTFSGRWARGLRNKFMEEVEKSGIEIPAYPIQANLTARVRARSQQQDNKEFTSLWAGQSASHAESKPAAEIFYNLIKQAEEFT